MAIQFARIEIVGRSSGGSACCKGAYNARDKVKDEQTGITYNFQNKKDNVYHAVLLPEHADKKFSSVSKLMNEIEKCEKRKDSQLLKDIVLALPDDKELTLQDRINITHLLIEKRGWVKEGLGVQVDIHKPHDDEKNWHAHLLVTTRRFTEDGLTFGLKATDLNPEFKKSGNRAFAVPEADQIHEDLRDIVNDYFKMLGLENRVNAISQLPQEHIGPVRMRSVLNQAAERNEAKQLANIEQLNSGQALINRVSASKSVFNERDLQRELKCIPDDNRRNTFFSEALKSNSLVALYSQDGSSANYYTTHEIRLEEQKIIRLSGYLVNEENVVAANTNRGQVLFGNVQQLISDSSAGLSDEQGKALSNILLDKNGLRILRGRAGTGKSYVLGQANSIASNSGINVIGLAPTHKAKLELRAQGFERVDTIKGMLFGLAHGRFDLPKHSLLVVDEAGMIGNDDMSELLRVAATRKCNVILSGDERQLASVQRGGMFEVLADKYGSSSILDIKRQDNEWGRNVAMAMSEGNTETAISILDGKQRIKWEKDSSASMSSLLSDWNNSNHVISDRLILAVKNKDVASLNHGARQYLKSDGTLKGEEIAVNGNYYMQGDKILITKTSKELGVVNGDIAELTHVSKGKFRCNIAAKEISFNPAEYNGFRHGYATTVFKAQGASISDVYVYHDGFAGMRNSYVALSRNKINLNLYANKQSCRSNDALIKQLSQDSEIGSSLGYLTKSEVLGQEAVYELENDKNIFVKGLNSLIDFALNTATKLSDKNIPVSEYYTYREPSREVLPVEKVLDQIAVEQEAVGMGIEDKIAVGDNNVQITSTLEQNTNTTTKSKMTAKERFYANVDHSRNRANSRADLKQQWDRESHELREATKFKAEQITRGLLGDPNNKLSNKSTLRYGEHGKLAVRISGDKAGTWYDFSKSEGGDIFSLVQDAKNTSFKEAAEYLKSSVGISSTSNIKLVYDHKARDAFLDSHKAKQADEAEARQKAKYNQALYARAKDINSKNVAHHYLNQERGINCDLSADIKTAGIYDKNADKSFPALVAFARDKDGNITGGQRLLLDAKTKNKANVDVPKKSFGKIAGSFVAISQVNKPEVTIIAEGLETGLSIKQALSEHNQSHRRMKTQIICSLGISNIKNYQPSKGEKLIIAADNDGTNSITQKTIENAKIELERKGAFVEILRPEQEGDFNDVLKSLGSKVISASFEPVIDRQTAKTVAEYFGKDSLDTKLNDNDRSSLAYIEKYNVPQDALVEAYRKSDLSGKVELDHSRKGLEMAVNAYNNNKSTIDDAKTWGCTDTAIETTKSLIGMDSEQSKKYCIQMKDDYLSDYLNKNISEFDEQKHMIFTLDKIKPIISAEQQFLKETYKALTTPIEEHTNDNQRCLEAGKVALEKPEMLEAVCVLADRLVAETSEQEMRVVPSLSDVKDMHTMQGFLAERLEYHNYYRVPKILEQEKLLSKTVESSFEAISKEQDIYADMHDNIIYHAFDKELLQRAETSYLQKDNSELDKLKEIAQKSLDTGAKTEESLLKDLHSTTDLKQSREEISGAIESHNIKKTLGDIELELAEVKTPTDILNTLSKRQDYICEIDSSLQYPEHLDNELSNLISLNKLEKDENSLGSLNKLVAFVVNEKLHDNAEITTHLKRPLELKSVIENLTINYQTKHLQNVEQNLTQIEKQGHVLVEKQRFDCPIRYLDHEKTHSSNNEYSAHQELDKIYQKTTTAMQTKLENEKLETQLQSQNKRMDFER